MKNIKRLIFRVSSSILCGKVQGGIILEMHQYAKKGSLIHMVIAHSSNSIA